MANNFKIVVDSASDITADEAVQRDLIMMPMIVSFGQTDYEDGVNLSHKQFFEKLIESDELPKTACINEFRFAECFEKETKDGSQLLVITISSKLSTTYNQAVSAAKKFAQKVFVVDSLNACIGERVLVELALRLRDAGKSAEEVKALLDERKQKIKLIALLGTLKYLKKGGRISTLVAFAGELLSIKPVVEVIKGEVKLVGKAMGSKKGNNLLTKMIEDSGGIDFGSPFALGYSGLSDDLLLKYVEDSRALYENDTNSLPIYMIGSTIGTHVGPGAIAVAFFAK